VRKKESDETSVQLQKKHDAIQGKLDSIAKEFENTKVELALVKAQKDPLSALRNASIADKDFKDFILTLPTSAKKSFDKRLEGNRALRDREINTDQIINDAKAKYQLESALIFQPNPKKPGGALKTNPILLATITKVIQKANKNGQSTPAYQELKDLFNGAKTDDSNKSIFWVAQGDGKPSALNVSAIETLLEHREDIEKLYKATLKDEASVKDFNRELFKQDWKEYSETIDAFLQLKIKVSGDAKPLGGPNPPDKLPAPPENDEKKGKEEKGR
jgi:hypothetical protein